MGGRILLVDGVATHRIYMTALFRKVRYDLSFSASKREAINDARRNPPDLIIIADTLPDGAPMQTLAALKAHPKTRAVPVVLLSAERTAETAVQALAAGAEDIVETPLVELVFLAKIRSLLRARETDRALDQRQNTVQKLGFAESATGFVQAGTVALVSEDKDQLKGWAEGLRRHMRLPLRTLGEEGALAAADSTPAPDLFVISANLDVPGDGLRLLAELRARPGSRHAAVIIICEPDDTASIASALDLGANDLLLNAFDPKELSLRVKSQLARKHRADKLRSSVEDGLRLAITDPLTGLYNRRYAYTHIDQIDQIARNTGRRYALMLADIDRFKSINDIYGHGVGDLVLTKVAHCLKDHLRSMDMAARIGGEEFLIAMPKTNAKDALLAAERLRTLVARTPIYIEQSETPIHVTISIGLAMSNEPGGLMMPVQALVEQADRALFSAKADGRNQVILSRTAA